MKQGIVIGTAGGREKILDECLNYLGGYHKYPIAVYADNVGFDDFSSFESSVYIHKAFSNTWELGALEHYANIYDEFFFIHDTCVVSNPEIFDIAFQSYLGMSVAYGPYFSGYIGKWRRASLDKLDIPTIKTKEEAIEQEFLFTREYAKLERDNLLVADPTFRDNYEHNTFEHRFGRKNLVLNGKWIQKYKGTWGEWVGEIPK